jgi:hypothetical protein
LFLIFAFVLDIFVIMNHLLVGLCHDIPEILLSLTPIEITQYIHLHSDVFMKYTTTSFFHNVRLWGIATPTAHKVTTFNSDGRCIAFSPLCSFEIYRCVFITKCGGGLKIH